MGYMCYHAIVVTDSGYGDFIIEAHAVATALFRSEVIQRDTYSADKAAMVSPILLAPINGHRSFFIAPDGSKEGWDISKNGNTARAKFREYLRSLEYADGSTPLKWVEVQYGDDDLVTAIIDDSDATWRNINRRKDSSIESSGDEDTNLRNAEAAEARADEMEVDRDNWKARADAAEYEVMARPGIDKQFQELNDELIATRAQLDTLQAAGEWQPRVPGPIFNADSAPHGVKSILYLSVDATRDLDSGLWDWDDNGDWYVHGYQPLPTPPADDSERYNPREPGQ